MKSECLDVEIGLKKQVEMIKFHMESKMGKNFQILIYGGNQEAGHCLFSSEEQFIIAKYKGYIYIIWRVNLVA